MKLEFTIAEEKVQFNTFNHGWFVDAYGELCYKLYNDGDTDYDTIRVDEDCDVGFTGEKELVRRATVSVS